eukprot:3649051-Alexandrium_andersonii.AAC.2
MRKIRPTASVGAPHVGSTGQSASSMLARMQPSDVGCLDLSWCTWPHSLAAWQCALYSTVARMACRRGWPTSCGCMQPFQHESLGGPIHA